jgi:hypothetical protein
MQHICSSLLLLRRSEFMDPNNIQPKALFSAPKPHQPIKRIFTDCAEVDGAGAGIPYYWTKQGRCIAQATALAYMLCSVSGYPYRGPHGLWPSANLSMLAIPLLHQPHKRPMLSRILRFKLKVSVNGKMDRANDLINLTDKSRTRERIG